ncbi:hypothetical protein [Anaeromicropila herbilytica]|uniref:BclA C-terminal domain-containing protein n=1 Tax=Anaeromicropila herbilytica TaxID=2785025 RepID=A0A7R7EP28_9FIRM|nr:hypothetical protein [Anaeromicropila herbilytica]BCN32105.1 hypothetical protein bsdtb5_34000 [Anaeromicropila herbilytica]
MSYFHEPHCPITIDPTIQTGLGGTYNERNTGATVLEGGVITFNSTTFDRKIGFGVSFNKTTGIITIDKAGFYLFDWTFLAGATDAGEPIGVLIALESTTGIPYALSGNTGLPLSFSGSTLIELPAGATLQFVNRSGHSITLVNVTGSGGLSFGGSLTVARIENVYSTKA